MIQFINEKRNRYVLSYVYKKVLVLMMGFDQYEKLQNKWNEKSGKYQQKCYFESKVPLNILMDDISYFGQYYSFHHPAQVAFGKL